MSTPLFPPDLGESLSNSGVGCLGAVLLVVLTAGGAFGLVALTWWIVLRSLAE
jgi:hypothetical protein